MNTNQLHHSNVRHRQIIDTVWAAFRKVTSRTLPTSGTEWWSWLQQLGLGESNPSILLVAQSNEAVDNLYKNIQEGRFVSFTGAGDKCEYKPKMVRFGRGGKDKTIQNLSTTVDALMTKDPGAVAKEKNNLQRLVNHHQLQLGNCLTAMYTSRTRPECLVAPLINHYNLCCDLGNELKKYTVLTQQRIDRRNQREVRQSLERYCIQSADIVGCTLNSSADLSRYRGKNGQDITFAVCIVDEAGESIFHHTLIQHFLGFIFFFVPYFEYIR